MQITGLLYCFHHVPRSGPWEWVFALTWVLYLSTFSKCSCIYSTYWQCSVCSCFDWVYFIYWLCSVCSCFDWVTMVTPHGYVLCPCFDWVTMVTPHGYVLCVLALTELPWLLHMAMFCVIALTELPWLLHMAMFCVFLLWLSYHGYSTWLCSVCSCFDCVTMVTPHGYVLCVLILTECTWLVALNFLISRWKGGTEIVANQRNNLSNIYSPGGQLSQSSIYGKPNTFALKITLFSHDKAMVEATFNFFKGPGHF